MFSPPMPSRRTPPSANIKTRALTGAQLTLCKTLKTLEAQRDKANEEIRLIQSALAAMGVTNPNLAARARRKPMNAAERRSVSKRMKAYWAKRRSK